jgi:hypothetical protein
MELNLMNMSSVELEMLEQDTQAKLDLKLRNMMYDDHMDELFEKMEEIRAEKRRRELK